MSTVLHPDKLGLEQNGAIDIGIGNTVYNFSYKMAAVRKVCCSPGLWLWCLNLQFQPICINNKTAGLVWFGNLSIFYLQFYKQVNARSSLEMVTKNVHVCMSVCADACPCFTTIVRVCILKTFSAAVIIQA